MEHRPDDVAALLSRTLVLALAAALAAVGPAVAQGHGGEKGGHGGMTERGGHAMEMRGGHGAMLGHLPAAVLRQGDLLELSDDQRRRLEALRDSVEAVRRDRGGEPGAMHERAASAFGEDGIDVEAYESALRSLADRRVAARVRVARIARRALDVLDDAQREKFLYGVHLMQRMHRMHHGGHGKAMEREEMEMEHGGGEEEGGGDRLR